MNEKLREFFNVLTTNTDGTIEFISTMEGMYHPTWTLFFTYYVYINLNFTVVYFVNKIMLTLGP